MPLNFRILLSVRQSLVLMTEFPCHNIHQHLQTVLFPRLYNAVGTLPWGLSDIGTLKTSVSF